MKIIHQITVLIFSIYLLGACNKEEISTTLPPLQEDVLTILPLGDSRVEGNRPDYESYRYELWKNFVENNWPIDFVGTREDEGNYTAFQGTEFDRDHEGTGGAQTTDILRTLEAITPENTPPIVLLGIGGNDLLDGGKTVAQTISNIEEIIHLLQSRNEQITIFLEQIAPAKTNFMTDAFRNKLDQFNAQILAVGNAQTTVNSKIIVIDMAANWSDEYMADEVHYNEKGAKVVADRYFEAISATLE